MTEFITRNYGNKDFEIIIKTDSKEHYKATEDFARRLIDHAKPVTDNNVGCKWIPVTERLPQEYGEVCKNVNLLMDDGFVTVGWLNQVTNKGYYLDAENDYVIHEPLSRFTHWMPLPRRG